MGSKVDILLGGLIPNSACLDNLVDISFPYTEDYLVWFLRTDPINLSWIVLLDAFQYKVWASLFIFMFLGSMVIFVSSWFGYHRANQVSEKS